MPNLLYAAVARLLVVFAAATLAGAAVAQSDRVAEFKQALAANKQRLAHYGWVETTTVSLNGDVKSQTEKQCYYGADGTVQKTEISATPSSAPTTGVRGRIAARKKGQITDYMQQCVDLVHQYVPPNPAQIDAAKNAGNLSISPLAGGAVAINIRNYLKPGDTLGLVVDAATNSLLSVKVASYIDSQQDAVTLDVGYGKLNDGTSYPARTTLVAAAKNITVVVQNSGYRPMN